MSVLGKLGAAIGVVVAIAGLGVAAPACSKSVPQAVCKAVCDCEHCSSETERITCAEYEADLRVATDYGCDAKWNAWADCVQSEGTCIDATATYSTKAMGHCSRLYDIGLPCAQTSDCAPLGVSGAACIDGKCQLKQCEETGRSCSEDAECPTSVDKCATQANDLASCEAAASGHPGTFPTAQPRPTSPGSPAPSGTGG
jgi:carboxypeptidase C (cathepsin A)